MTFSVYQFFADGTHERVRDGVDAVEAVRAAALYTISVGAQLGTTVRVIITDAEDFTTFEWRHGEGIVFPLQLAEETVLTFPLPPGDVRAAIDLHQMAIEARFLPIWVVTENPRDFPGQFVARLQASGRGGVYGANDADVGLIVRDTLAEVRAALALFPHGLTCLARHPSDDPVIVESWL